MTEIIILLALFGIKHFICDFMLQFDYMVKEKAVYGMMGGVHHAMLHAVFTLIILLVFLHSPALAFGLAALDGILHYHIDWTKQQFSKGLGPADRKFWIYLGADQALHYLTYVLIIGWALGAL
jgi:hypothetical protein